MPLSVPESIIIYLGHMSSLPPIIIISSPILPRPLFARPTTPHSLSRLDPCRQPHPSSLAPFFSVYAPSPHASLFTTQHTTTTPRSNAQLRRSDAQTLSFPHSPAAYHLSTVSLSFHDSRTTMRSTIPRDCPSIRPCGQDIPLGELSPQHNS